MLDTAVKLKAFIGESSKGAVKFDLRNTCCQPHSYVAKPHRLLQTHCYHPCICDR
jgi:hypothetical protein